MYQLNKKNIDLKEKFKKAMIFYKIIFKILLYNYNIDFNRYKI